VIIDQIEHPVAAALLRDPRHNAPEWFAKAVGVTPERSMVPVGEAQIELLTWGERGRPGLLFVPGMCAHADWWSFIAPTFLPRYRVAALSLSGMGSSSWRPKYYYEHSAEELIVCAEAAGLYGSGQAPVFIGHSHGGWAAFYAALKFPERMAGAILIDTAYNARGPADRPAVEAAPAEPVKEMVYDTLEEALNRFRLYPDQPCENDFITDFIARRSVKKIATPAGDRWTWRFDPQIFVNISPDGFPLQNQPAPLTHLIGERSLMMARTGGDQPPLLRRYMPSVRIPEAGHHIMIDQPLALVAAIRAVLAQFRKVQA
jgi:pimeloyl-ACP methyl ester carboxylesterase